MAFHDNIILLIVGHKNKIKIFVPFNLESIIVYLVMPYDETKFTFFKIQMYYHVTILVDHWRGNSTLSSIPPRDV